MWQPRYKIMNGGPKDEKELTLKQRKFMKEYLECGNATEAAIRVYDTEDRDSAAVIGHENLRKLNFTDLLEEAGVTDELLIKTLKNGLTADKHTEDGPMADHPTRHRYLETGAKLKGRLIDKQKHEIEGGFFSTDKLKIVIVDGEKPESEPEAEPSSETA